jgi:malonate decarboxylase gamma subunit
MTLDDLLAALFGADLNVTHQGDTFSGEARFGERPLALLGTVGGAPLSAEGAHSLAGAVLSELRRDTPRPMLILLDNSSQRLALQEELIGNCRYFAHLAQCIDLAERLGRKVIVLVYRQAVSGGFLAAGMSGSTCYALPDAELRVMDLAAMARITRLPLERLQALCAASPVFAPGVANFHALGIVEEVWNGDLRAHLAAALDKADLPSWRARGHARKGRSFAYPVSQMVRTTRE